MNLKSGEVGADGSGCISEPEAIGLFVCPASHAYVHYLMAEKTKLPELLRLGEVSILVYSVFVRQRYVQ